MEKEVVIKIEDVKKQYRLGAIGGGTLQGDLQSWWARVRGKEDPNTKIGQEQHKGNEKFYALNGINFEVYKGERLGIIGGNGAGKSTTLKLLSRVTAPTEGTIYINGRISSMLEVGTGFHPELTGRENIYLNGAILGMTKAEVDSKIEDIIDFSECRQFIDTPVKRYSSGMYVKLAFSVAAHLDSEILVMDEVLAVGDMKFQQKCLGKMSDVAENEGRTVLYVSHNMNTIRQLCDRCIVLNHGEVVFDGDVEEAISIYLESSNEKINNNIDLINLKRGNIFYGKKVKFSQFRFKNQNGAYLSFGEKIFFTLDISVSQNIQNVYFRCMIYFIDNQPICMTTTNEGLKFFKIGMNRYDCILDTSPLAPGKYKIKIALYVLNDFGSEELLDVLDNCIYFIIEESNSMNNMTWLHQWWGHIKLNNIRIENSEVINDQEL